MANNGRITRGSIPRALQYGLDKIIDQEGKSYKGVGDEIFTKVMTEKGFYEFMQLAGMGMAARKGEGESITADSIDQSWVYRTPVFTYEKSARITREMIKDNVYENVLPRIAREQLKALAHARDQAMADVLNRSETSGYTFGDGKVLCATDHPTQAGPVNSNLLSPAVDLSEDALEQLVYLIDNFVNDDGLLSSYDSMKLVVPTALRFEAVRIVRNSDRPATADRDINAMYSEGSIKDLKVWKRLTDTDAFYVTTNADNGLLMVQREGIFTQSMMDFDTYDTKLTAAERYAVTVGDHRCIVKSAGV